MPILDSRVTILLDVQECGNPVFIMLHKLKKYWLGLSPTGQNMTEYLIVFVGVVVTLIAVAGPTGIFTKKIEESLKTAVIGTKCLALQVCYDPDGCDWVPNDGCCEAGENINNSPEDCSLCLSDADCDDGDACNGVETCHPSTGCQPGVGVCNNCPYGIQHGSCGDFYEFSSVPYGDSCGAPESRCCDNGNLSGSYTATSCTVSGPANCGPGFPHGTWGEACAASSVPCGNSCQCESRYCNNGTLEGGMQGYTVTGGCTVEICGSCPDPSGGPDILNGESKTFYQRATVDCYIPCSSEQEVRTCNNGVLSGSYTEGSCIQFACEDGVPCTYDDCDPNTLTNYGCTNIPDDSKCNDGLTCTGIEDASTLPTPRISPASNGDDYCDATNDCQFDPHDDWCDDGIDCTLNICDLVSDCQNPVDPGYCDDGVGCTDDWCDTASDCQFDVNDANCTNTVECADGICDEFLDCQYTPNPDNCDDGIDCTDDTCDASYLCSNVPNDALCPDDGISCTTELCDVELGGCRSYPDDALCDDGVSCTSNYCDTWYDCVNTPDDALCNDEIDCTDDWCDAVADCQFDVNDANCDDNNVCNGIEVCLPFEPFMGCEASIPVPCNDGNPCTTDSCDPITGCEFTFLPNCCGNETCEAGAGEDCNTCELDCGVCDDCTYGTRTECTSHPNCIWNVIATPNVVLICAISEFCTPGIPDPGDPCCLEFGTVCYVCGCSLAPNCCSSGCCW